MICTFIQLCVNPKGCQFVFIEIFFVQEQEIDNRVKFDYVSVIWGYVDVNQQKLREPFKNILADFAC